MIFVLFVNEYTVWLKAEPFIFLGGFGGDPFCFIVIRLDVTLVDFMSTIYYSSDIDHGIARISCIVGDRCFSIYL